MHLFRLKIYVKLVKNFNTTHGLLIKHGLHNTNYSIFIIHEFYDINIRFKDKYSCVK